MQHRDEKQKLQPPAGSTNATSHANHEPFAEAVIETIEFIAASDDDRAKSARCLADKLEALGDETRLPADGRDDGE